VDKGTNFSVMKNPEDLLVVKVSNTQNEVQSRKMKIEVEINCRRAISFFHTNRRDHMTQH